MLPLVLLAAWVLVSTGCEDAGIGNTPNEAWSPPVDTEPPPIDDFRETRGGKRYMSIIALNPEKVSEYQELHQDISPAVRQALNESGIYNYSIFIKSIDDQYYAVRYFEHTGGNLEVAMAKLDANADFRKWRDAYELCQLPIPSNDGKIQWWSPMEEIAHVE